MLHTFFTDRSFITCRIKVILNEIHRKGGCMKNEFKKMSLSRLLLAGLLCGIITAIIDVVYAGIYRDATDLEKYSGIGPTIIFIAIPLTFLIVSGFYYLLVHYFNKGELFFIAVFAVVALIGITIDMNFRHSVGQTLMTTAHGLFFGMEIITGLAICILLPYFAHHPRIYMTKDEMNWE